MVLGRQTLFGNGALQAMRAPTGTQYELGKEMPLGASELPATHVPLVEGPRQGAQELSIASDITSNPPPCPLPL